MTTYLNTPHFPAAVCRSADPEIFYADETQRRYNREAKAICNTCPEQQPCLQWALDTREAFGIWGGATARERQRMRTGLGLPPAERAADTNAGRRSIADRTARRREQAQQLRRGGKTPDMIARLMGMHLASIKRYLRDAS